MSRLSESLELLVALNRARAEHDGDFALRLQEMLEEHDNGFGYSRPVRVEAIPSCGHRQSGRRGTGGE